jgi:hypothetical protein
VNPTVDLSQEIIMKAKQLTSATIAVIALSPFAAFAGGGDQGAKEWLDSLKSTRSAEEVRAEAREVRPTGQFHPAESTRTREEVRTELTTYPAEMIGA